MESGTARARRRASPFWWNEPNPHFHAPPAIMGERQREPPSRSQQVLKEAIEFSGLPITLKITPCQGQSFLGLMCKSFPIQPRSPRPLRGLAFYPARMRKWLRSGAYRASLSSNIDGHWP